MSPLHETPQRNRPARSAKAVLGREPDFPIVLQRGFLSAQAPEPRNRAVQHVRFDEIEDSFGNDFGFEISSFVPPGLAAESVLDAADQLSIIVTARTQSAACPTCGVEASRVHSRYIRQAQDLPCSGKYVRLRVFVRRFFCDARDCAAKIFAERFGEDILARRGGLLGWNTLSASLK